MFDKELMKQLATIPAESRAEWIAERKKLEALAGEMTRLNVEEMIPKYGIARVLRVLAATIKQSPMEYDSDVVTMANWIPPKRGAVVLLNHPPSIYPGPVSPVCEPSEAMRKELKP